MLIIEWLNCLPNADGVIIFKKTATNCDTAAEAVAEADTLWPTVQTIDHHIPDGFQVVDQDGRLVQLARYARDRPTSAEPRLPRRSRP